MSGSEGSSTKQSTSRVSQGRLDGASEGGNAWLAVTTADARIPIKRKPKEIFLFRLFFCVNFQYFVDDFFYLGKFFGRKPSKALAEGICRRCFYIPKKKGVCGNM